jgi:hypothetical protein
VARNHGNLQVHLVNTSGPHATEPFVDAIAPVGPLEVTLRLGSRPKEIRLEPEGRELQFRQVDGETRVTVPTLAIHSALVVE